MFFQSSFLAWAALFLSSSSLLSAAPTKVNGGNSGYPGLLEATTEELAGGLKKGLFTSVDLVNVSLSCHLQLLFLLLSQRRGLAKVFTGIHCAHPGGQ
jgi:hypothetical protein